MKKASIISIGNEILSGQTIDTNAAYLSGKLALLSIPTVSSYTVGDNIEYIVRSLKFAAEDADLILITGGLGPTDDDITRQGIAKFLDVELELQEYLLKQIASFFTSRKLQMPERNNIQACIPAGAKALTNDVGTAPGIIAELGGKIFAAMPGVPSEMKVMFEKQLLCQLERFGDGQFVLTRKLRCFGTGESAIAEMLGDSMRRDRNPLINCTVSSGVITLHIIATATDEDEAAQMVAADEKQLRDKLGDLVYGVDNETLADAVGRSLSEQKKTIATAESCTGGLVSKLLTDSSGASEYFTHGWVTYSNQAKVDQLGVPCELIEENGAVSQPVAEAMAHGARVKAGADFGIGITGIAGPAGGTMEKPVGLVYICVESGKKTETRRVIFSGNREAIRLRAARTAINMLRSQL